jgi:hypothetical protein
VSSAILGHYRSRRMWSFGFPPGGVGLRWKIALHALLNCFFHGLDWSHRNVARLVESFALSIVVIRVSRAQASLSDL